VAVAEAVWCDPAAAATRPATPARPAAVPEAGDNVRVSRTLVLASQSPRRSELLRNAGIAFTIRARPVAEVRERGEAPEAYVVRLARAKAEAAWEGRDEIVLGADTVVVLDGEVLEKPGGAASARAMLQRLSGREHTVITGICLRHAAGEETACESTTVRFLHLSAEEIEAYVATGEPMDKAGAYAIQGLASKFVVGVDGCFFNVVGLPVSHVYRYLKALENKT
jgi:septum formation protein